MKKGILLFVFLCLLSIQGAFAQYFAVQGCVTSSENDMPLIGVAVMQKGSTNGVITDIEGNYTIEIRGTEEAVLEFSYMGYGKQEHKVSSATQVLNVVMQSEVQEIDEFVYVAYGVRK